MTMKIVFRKLPNSEHPKPHRTFSEIMMIIIPYTIMK